MACAVVDPNQQEWTSKTKSLNPFFGKEQIYRYMETKGATKHREAGLRLFSSGHLQKLEFSTREAEDTIVRAQVLASMSIRTSYKVNAALAKCDGEIITGHCSCVAGKGSVCKHLCCVFYGLMYIAQHDLSVVPGVVACTETERQWYKPRDPRKVSEQFGTVVFCKDTCERMSSAPKHHEKRVAYSSLKGDRLNLQPLDLIHLHGKLYESGLHCFADVLEANDFVPNKVKESDSEATEKLPPRWLDQVEKQLGLTAYTPEEIAAVEEGTRLQSLCPLWHHYREGIITASLANRVYTWVHTCRTKVGPHDPRSLSNAVLGKTKCRATNDMKRGLLLEPEARTLFQEKNASHVDLDVKESGLFLSQSHPFLGASPDGIVSCSCCEKRLIEIKCPRSLATFSKSELHDGRLKPTSKHYAQVQMQMGVTGRKLCILFVYCSKDDYRQVSVPFDEKYFHELVERCTFFYDTYFLPCFRC
ncbi:uncharacterized protein LOC121047403 [Ixodes scapularis]|uniref:uncharacterized protein LOC121047403 n=1 Tax=Ixodes scapularis TaxID=6945 RepID=UPI001AD751F7|nr:uncharacterized protein LOC121047403 [Ixodes scapularis]